MWKPQKFKKPCAKAECNRLFRPTGSAEKLCEDCQINAKMWTFKKITRLTARDKIVLRKLVKCTCQQCHKHEKEVGILQPHRITRGNAGGEYVLGNIKMICSKCHKLIHYGEPGII